MSTYEIARDVGIVDPVHMRQIAAIKRNCENQLATNWALADNWCSSILDYIRGVGANVVSYDATIFNYDLDSLENPYLAYLSAANSKIAELYTSLHISNSPKSPKFQQGNNDVYNAIEAEEYIDWTHFYDDALTLNGGIDILVYAGVYDQQDGPLTMHSWMKDLQTLQRNDDFFWKQARKIYYVADGVLNQTVGGYYRTDQRFTFLAVPDAGHFVPSTNMKATRQFLQDYLSPARALGCYNATRELVSKCSTADIMCSYMKNSTSGNDCMDNGVCDAMVTGRCTCNDGFRGADCSKPVTLLHNGFAGTYSFSGSKTFFMQYNAGVQPMNDFDLVLSNVNPIDVFISAGLSTDPNEFHNDIEIKG